MHILRQRISLERKQISVYLNAVCITGNYNLQNEDGKVLPMMKPSITRQSPLLKILKS